MLARLAGAPEEPEPLLWGRLLRRGRRGRRLVRPGELVGQGEDVLRDLAVPVADDERDAAVHREDERAAVGHDRVRDLAGEACLDVRRLDPARAVVAVRHQHLIAVVLTALLT